MKAHARDVVVAKRPHQKIRLLRKNRGLTMKQLAERTGTSQQQIDRLEKGYRRLTLEWMERLSDALDCRLTELLPPEHHILSESDVVEEEGKEAECAARAKVIGVVSGDGGLEFFEKAARYTVMFGRPKQLRELRLFGLQAAAGGVLGFAEGSELIFSEVSPEDGLVQIPDGSCVICLDNASQDYFVTRIPISNPALVIKAVLVKSICDEL